jgi:protease-4
MRTVLPVVVVALLGSGCHRFVFHTDSRVDIPNPVETRVDIPPVSPSAGPVRPVVVQAGNSGSRVAIVDVDGVILNSPFVGPLSVGENPVALFREKLDAIEAERGTKAVVLRINSPGGGVAACQAMRRDLERFKARTGIPVVACLMDTAAGGAYYLASATDHVVAGPATVTGGLGVILNLYNLEDLMGQFNIRPRPVKAGNLVNMGSFVRLPDEDEEQVKERLATEGKILQSMADDFHQQLQGDIRRSRPRLRLDGGTTFDGRIFTGTQAMARGLVDRIGDLDEALQVAAQMASPGAPAAAPQVVLYRRANDPARSVYAVTANIPLQGSGLLPSLPGLDRSKLPTFLSMWQPDLTMEKLGGK